MTDPASPRVIASRTLTYVGEHVLRVGVAAVAGLVVARSIGPEGLGELSYAHAIFGLFLPIVSLGMPTILIREFSTADDWRPVLASALRRQLAVAWAVTLVAVLVLAGTRSFSSGAWGLALALAPLPALSVQVTLRAYLEATGRSTRIASVATTAALVAAAAKVLVVVVLGAPLWAIALATTLEAALMTLGYAMAIASPRSWWPSRRHANAHVMRRLTSEAWPLLISGFGTTIFMRADLIMLGLMAGDAEAGNYAAAVRLSELWYFLPIAGMAALRPRLSALHAAGQHAVYWFELRRFFTLAVGGAYVIVATMLLWAEPIVNLLYGSGFAATAPIIRIHILAAPFIFISIHPFFIDRGNTRFPMITTSIAAAINVALNLLLIPGLGARGAAIATVAAYVFNAWLVNAAADGARPLFRAQAAALALRWGSRAPDDPGQVSPGPAGDDPPTDGMRPSEGPQAPHR